MKIAGIILIAIQCVGTLGSIIAGNNPFSGGFFGTLGYFLVGIIGVILLITAVVREKKKENQESNQADFMDEEIEPDLELNQKSNDESPNEKFTRMFRQPFPKEILKEELIINEKNCVIYTFLPRLSQMSDIGTITRIIEVKEKIPRYFAVEYSFDNTLVLCEWVFEGEREKNHINYGEVMSLNNLKMHENTIKILKQILV